MFVLTCVFERDMETGALLFCCDCFIAKSLALFLISHIHVHINVWEKTRDINSDKSVF